MDNDWAEEEAPLGEAGLAQDAAPHQPHGLDTNVDALPGVFPAQSNRLKWRSATPNKRGLWKDMLMW